MALNVASRVPGGFFPSPRISRAKPAVVKGDPRSLTKTKGDDGLSRWSRRSARSSSPWIGWVLGVPFLTRRTCRTAPANPATGASQRGCGTLFSVQEVPTRSLTPEVLQILGQTRKSLCELFVHKGRDIASARARQFGVSLRLFPIALCSLRPAFHFQIPPFSLN
jgi:hypothetical protein